MNKYGYVILMPCVAKKGAKKIRPDLSGRIFADD